MALKKVEYICCGCRQVFAIRIKEAEIPRRTMVRTCPKCDKYHRCHIWSRKPITRKDTR